MKIWHSLWDRLAELTVGALRFRTESFGHDQFKGKAWEAWCDNAWRLNVQATPKTRTRAPREAWERWGRRTEHHLGPVEVEPGRGWTYCILDGVRVQEVRSKRGAELLLYHGDVWKERVEAFRLGELVAIQGNLMHNLGPDTPWDDLVCTISAPHLVKLQWQGRCLGYHQVLGYARAAPDGRAVIVSRTPAVLDEEEENGAYSLV